MSALDDIVDLDAKIEASIREKDRAEHGGVPLNWVRHVEGGACDLAEALAFTQRRLHELWSLARARAPVAELDAAAFRALDSLNDNRNQVGLLVGDAGDKARELEAFLGACADAPDRREDA